MSQLPQKTASNNLNINVPTSKTSQTKDDHRQEDTAVLHDITLAYRDFIPGKRTTDASIVKGEFPTSIHMLVNRIELRNIPLGEKEDGQAEDHVVLVGQLNKIKKLSQRLVYSSSNASLKVHPTDEESQPVSDLIALLKDEFFTMDADTREHFKEEEIYWPPILKKYGPVNWDRAEALLVVDGLNWGDENAGIPTFDFMDASTTSPEELEHDVLH
eukprot:gene27448-34165_t